MEANGGMLTKESIEREARRRASVDREGLLIVKDEYILKRTTKHQAQMNRIEEVKNNSSIGGACYSYS